MAKSPQELSRKISELFVERARRFKRASFYVKAGLVVFASALVGAAQLLQIPEGGSLTVAQAVGLGASVLLVFGGIFVLITEEDASKELSLARLAAEEARDAAEALGVLDERDEILKRVTHLYLTTREMRRVLERSAATELPLTTTIRLLIGATHRLLPVAADFAQSDRWTICIYKTFESPAGGRDELACIDHLRAIPCEAKDARRWAEGVGVAGIAYATRARHHCSEYAYLRHWVAL